MSIHQCFSCAMHFHTSMSTIRKDRLSYLKLQGLRLNMETEVQFKVTVESPMAKSKMTITNHQFTSSQAEPLETNHQSLVQLVGGWANHWEPINYTVDRILNTNHWMLFCLTSYAKCSWRSPSFGGLIKFSWNYAISGGPYVTNHYSPLVTFECSRSPNLFPDSKNQWESLIFTGLMVDNSVEI